LSFVLGADGRPDLLTCEHGDSSRWTAKRSSDGPSRRRRFGRRGHEIADVSPDDINLVIPTANVRYQGRDPAPRHSHGANRRHLDRYGNTSSSSIPLAFFDARENGRIKSGEYALMTGFGAGMSGSRSCVVALTDLR